MTAFPPSGKTTFPSSGTWIAFFGGTRYEDGYYRPEWVVTRDQMAVYVARAFGLEG